MGSHSVQYATGESTRALEHWRHSDMKHLFRTPTCPSGAPRLLEFGERLDLVLWETCHIYATCQAYRAEAEFQHSPISKRTEYAGLNGPIGLKP